MVETSSKKKSSAMCGRNIVEQKAEYNMWSKHCRTKMSSAMCGRIINEQKVE